jgi:hypothetical protein
MPPLLMRPRPRVDVALMRGRVLVVIPVMLVAVATGDVAPAQGRHRVHAAHCTVSGAPVGTHHVVAAAPGVEMTKIGANYYGCFVGTGKRVALFTQSAGTLADRTRHELRFPRVAGAYAAFVGEVEDPYGAPVASVVTVVDLRTRHNHRTAVDCLRSPFACVSSLVLAAGGQVAWMTAPSSNAPSGGLISVYARDASGQRMLDSDVDIDPASLLLNGLTVSWVRAGVMRSARLA